MNYRASYRALAFLIFLAAVSHTPIIACSLGAVSLSARSRASLPSAQSSRLDRRPQAHASVKHGLRH
jgi:hypothetical protein